MHAWMAILLKNQGNEPIPTQYQHVGKIFLLCAHIEAVNKLNIRRIIHETHITRSRTDDGGE